MKLFARALPHYTLWDHTGCACKLCSILLCRRHGFGRSSDPTKNKCASADLAAWCVAGPDCKLPKCGAVLDTLWNNTLAQLSATSVADAAAADSGTSSTLNALITYTGQALVRNHLPP